MLLARLLERTVRVGTLEVTGAHGARHLFSGAPGPEVTIRFLEAAVSYSPRNRKVGVRL